jgi:hypothetical protein
MQFLLIIIIYVCLCVCVFVAGTSLFSCHRLISEGQYADTEVEELLTMLRETENLEEQGDILQYLVDTQGLNYNTGIQNIIHI